MESMRSERWNESIWKKDLIKVGGPHVCVWSEEALGGDGVLGKICQVNYLGDLTRALPVLSACCQHTTIPRIEGTREGFSNWHNSRALRGKERSAKICFLQMFWTAARSTHKRKLAPTSEVRRYISLNCSHNS